MMELSIMSYCHKMFIFRDDWTFHYGIDKATNSWWIQNYIYSLGDMIAAPYPGFNSG